MMPMKRENPHAFPSVPNQLPATSGTPTRKHPRLDRAQLPSNWPYMLPEPKQYFRRRIAELCSPNAIGWAQGKCPFHKDPAAAFCVNLRWDQPQWRCFGGCGSGNMVDFHMRMYGLDFSEAVAELLLGLA